MALTKVSRGLISTSIVDNGNATAITIDSSENVSFTGAGTFSSTVTGTQFSSTSSSAALPSFGVTAGNGMYNPATNSIGWSTNSEERMRIADAEVHVGHTGATPPFAMTGTAFGISLYGSGGFISAARSGAEPLLLNRTSSDGDIIDLRKDGTTVGIIFSHSSGNMGIGTGDTGVLFAATSETLQPWNTSTNSVRDAAIDLGTNGGRFKDLYLSGGVYLGGTGAANHLDDYEEGSFTATASQGTIQNTYCKYIKVGNLVTVSGNVDVFSDRTSSTTIAILGLPFTVQSGTLATNGVMTNYISGSASTHVYAAAGASSMTLYQSNTSADLNPVSYSQLTSASSGFYFTFTYTSA